MSTINEWRGDVPAVSDVWTLTLTGPATGPGTLSVSVGPRVTSVAYVNTETAAVIMTRLYNALNNSAAAEVQEASYADSGTGTVTATAVTAGVPVTFSAFTATGATGLTPTLTHTTTATGPNYADNASNWSLGHKPTVGEEARIAGGSDILYGLSAMYGGACDATRILASFSGSIGLPKRNTNGNTPYFEYRQIYLTGTNGGTFFIGEGDGPAPARVRIQLAAGQVAFVYATGTSNEDNTPAVDFGTGGAAPGNISVFGGSAGYGAVLNAPDTCPTASVVGTQTSFFPVGKITTLNVRSGTVWSTAWIVTLNIQGGTYTQEQNRIDTIVADGGTIRLLHDQTGNNIFGTFRGSTSGDPPVLDATGNDRGGKVLTNTSTFTGGAFILNPYHAISLALGVKFDRQSFQASDLGNDVFTVTVT